MLPHASDFGLGIHLVLQGRGPGGLGLNTWGTVLAILILVLDILVIIRVVKSHKAFLVKVAWILLVVFLPVLGLIIYFFLGREK